MNKTHDASRARLLFLDVDGVLTDGRLYFLENRIMRAFHTLDGYGIRRLIKSGVSVAIISAAEDNGDVIHRARYLGITRVCLGVENKLAVVKQILEDEKLPANAAAYMGDDLPDLPSMEYVGFAAAPKTAAPEVLAIAHWVADLPAGAGAVRQLCDLILSSS